MDQLVIYRVGYVTKFGTDQVGHGLSWSQDELVMQRDGSGPSWLGTELVMDQVGLHQCCAEAVNLKKNEAFASMQCKSMPIPILIIACGKTL